MSVVLICSAINAVALTFVLVMRIRDDLAKRKLFRTLRGPHPVDRGAVEAQRAALNALQKRSHHE